MSLEVWHKGLFFQGTGQFFAVPKPVMYSADVFLHFCFQIFAFICQCINSFSFTDNFSGKLIHLNSNVFIFLILWLQRNEEVSETVTIQGIILTNLKRVGRDSIFKRQTAFQTRQGQILSAPRQLKVKRHLAGRQQVERYLAPQETTQ